ncbi:MAG: 3-deoxy-D-manno-octulosonic acid transferase [Candidatus Tectomicrobia bacterium]|uniref:3-deoxy-D-manno-octulosonic acid transferase n=1 Tax=Tectimicrobiota bacterium TaxID=2528274 RepID=A0A932M1I5_UNCTE|nr:3-deoxy-D-manno-octulosonic acid transferase [Candidatus Tectomicrobia bacterium]
MPSAAAERLAYLAYNALLVLAGVGGLPVLAWRLATRKKYRAGLAQRLGFSLGPVHNPETGPLLWLHAVSVGEVAASEVLVREITRRFPDLRIAVSTVTPTGQAVARQRLAEAQRIFFFPFDFAPAVRRSLEILRPSCFVMMETEIWPNMLRELKRRNVPSLMINGRISPRSFRRYRTLRPFMRVVLSGIDTFSMQTAEDARRIIDLGAPPQRVLVQGNLKYDGALAEDPRTLELSERFCREFSAYQAIVAGSTHPGEEELILSALGPLVQERPGRLLILAPRHLERLEEVEEVVRRGGLRSVRLSHFPSRDGTDRASSPVVVVDTLGELSALYRVGVLAFVGGSLVPFGGHNLLEPAAWKKPVLFGPHVDNFAEIAGALRAGGGGLQVGTPGDLQTWARRILENPALGLDVGEKAYRVVVQNQGAVERALQALAGSLNQREAIGI